MGRQIIRQWDEARTSLLGHDELLVLQGDGDSRNYVAWNHEMYSDVCPLCGNRNVKVQNHFSKRYTDCIRQNEHWQSIYLYYHFYKFRCLNPDCRHIFAKDISFAAKNDNVTYRLEHEIAKAVIDGKSFRRVSRMFQETITPQAVGQIFNRWVHKKADTRYWDYPLTKLGIVSLLLDKEECTIYLNLDNEIRVIEVQFGITSANISAFLRAHATMAQMVYTDCNPIISDVVSDVLPNARHIIPIDYWVDSVTQEFWEYAQQVMDVRSGDMKLEIITLPKSKLGYYIRVLNEILKKWPELQAPYECFNQLHEIVSRRDEMWVYSELIQWVEHLPVQFREALPLSLLQLEILRPEIEANIEYGHTIPSGLFQRTSIMQGELLDMRSYSDEVLKARILFSSESVLDHWNGIPILDVLLKLQEINKLKRGNEEYEYE